ncbi:MAG: hypothetical protein A2Y73_05745 [Chloroflexi bacterium RBG_13_56_8]|nr:MAG: hypothetical protein A2Y73_05745 [Chloroflexi bacterium RBG_13_56_8]
MVGLAMALFWLAFLPDKSVQEKRQRLQGYVERGDVVEQVDMARSFGSRVLLPMARGILRAIGRFAPKRSVDATRQLLLHAGEPGGLTVLDFYGVQLLSAVFMGAGWFWMASKRLPFSNALLTGLFVGAVGFFLPTMLLGRKVEGRKKEVLRALPNALDMLTIGVEAGLAFESAMLRVAERWDNALTREFRRVVLEMRVGTSRDVALERLAERTDVPDLRTFVAVLIQSTQLGVSIADVLHEQAATMRDKRRQRAEELARQASVKMAFPLVFLILPSIFVVIFGPAVPPLLNMFAGVTGGR